MQLPYTLLLSLLPLARAHFLLNSPPTIGFSDDDEGDYPCGSFDASSRTTVTNFPSGGIPISLTSTHPQVTYFYRVALLNDTNAWVDLHQPIAQVGQGKFCSQDVPGLAAWEGQDAVLQIAASAPDGWLFQCSAVKFVSGAATGPGSDCTNASSIKVSYVDEKLILNAQTTTIISGSSQPTQSVAGGSSTTQPASSSSTMGTPGAAASTQVGGLAILGTIIGTIGFFFF
ncbi:hypothetical protein Dda_7238 [Drechslerella dactyloides]|uniref:Copper acquisition factor BIM1-like domain-containing protein n=1 Tax=Drechslerella dactyloides TaxID=74499 RepID=A0AAD6NGJ9_DREDA|nr:hypothetical protein Dda_7238 [Drechslerella dactyloides]